MCSCKDVKAEGRGEIGACQNINRHSLNLADSIFFFPKNFIILLLFLSQKVCGPIKVFFSLHPNVNQKVDLRGLNFIHLIYMSNNCYGNLSFS